MRSEPIKIDYAGFTFSGKHTSQFGLYSVSNGDRYSRYLSPIIKNRTAENNGGIGTYFFGSQHTQQTFNFNLAFDSLTELELREIKEWLNSDVSSLILDESPYIEYYVKVSSAPQINFLPFESEEDLNLTISNSDILYNPQKKKSNTRVYKGEINITFTAYEPYGYNVKGKKWAEDYKDELNYDEWIEASGLISQENLEYNYKYDIPQAGKVYLYNAGMLPSDFIITLNTLAPNSNINFTIDNERYLELKIPNITINKLIIDTKKRLIIADEKVANNLIVKGDFFKIPIGESELIFPSTLTFPSDESYTFIEYRYYYF